MYSGQYSLTDPPARAGVFINVKTVASPRSRAGAAGIVGVVGQADWGPDNQIVEVGSAAEALTLFGTAGTLYFAVSQALTGEGLPDRSGASTVKAYRVTGSARAMATKVLSNGTTNALTLTAKYNGSRGNNLNVTTQTNAVDVSKKDLIIYEGTTQREAYTYAGTGAGILAALAADINARSAFVTATVTADGTALSAVANSSFTGGNSGTSLLTSDHASARAAFEADGDFSAFAVDDFAALGGSEQTAYRDWTVRLVEEGKLFHLVVGGLASETVSTATARSVTLDTPDITHVAGLGDVVVNLSRDLVIDGTTYSSSRMAPRIAGILAAADSERSITNAVIDGAILANPPSSSSVEQLVDGGVIPFYNDGGVVKLNRAQTSYATSVAATSEKANAFKSLLFIRKLWFVYKALGQMVSDNLIGKPIVNTASQRETILGMFEALLKTLEDTGKIIEGSTVDYDESQDNTGEILHLLIRLTPARGVEQVLIQVTVPV